MIDFNTKKYLLSIQGQYYFAKARKAKAKIRFETDDEKHLFEIKAT